MLKTLLAIGFAISISPAYAIDGRIVPDPMIVSRLNVSRTSTPAVDETKKDNLVAINLFFKGLLEFGSPFNRKIKLETGKAPTETEDGVLKFSHGSHTLARCEAPKGSVGMTMTGTDNAMISLKLALGRYQVLSNEVLVGVLEVKEDGATIKPRDTNALIADYEKLLRGHLDSRENVKKLLGLKLKGKTNLGNECEISIDSLINFEANWNEAALELKATAKLPEETSVNKQAEAETTQRFFAKDITVKLLERFNNNTASQLSEDGTTVCTVDSDIKELSFNEREKRSTITSSDGINAEIYVHSGSRSCTAKVDLGQ